MNAIFTNKYFLIGLGVYVAGAVLMGLELHLHNCDYPILRSLIWPVPLIRFLLGTDF